MQEQPRFYQKRPVKIRAIQWTGENHQAVADFAGHHADIHEQLVVIATEEGLMSAKVGDYIIEGVQGEYYPCRPDIFIQTYDEV